MSESLHHCYRRPNWLKLANSPLYEQDFLDFLKSHRYIRIKFKSKNRQAYYFFISCYGRAFVKHIREMHKKFDVDYDNLLRIIKTKWIKLPEE